MADVEAKRAAAIAAKEEARRQKNEEIKAKKKEMQAERDKQRSAKDAAELEAQKKREEAAKRREANIAAKEEARKGREAAAAEEAAGRPKGKSTKYSKRDVAHLKAVFDEYDHDGSGKISGAEFASSMRKKRDSTAPRPGLKSSREQRQQSEGPGLADMTESVFFELDADGDGEVTFAELLKLMYRYATPAELDTMLGWVADAPPPPPEPEKPLSAEAVAEIKAIFRLYDKDKSGSLTVKELVAAMEKTGIERADIKAMFEEHDTDGNNTIDFEEFKQMMKDSGNFDED